MPYNAAASVRRRLAGLAAASSLLLSAASPQPAADQVRLVWRAPAKATQFDAASTVLMHATFTMPGWLRGMAGHRADPVYVIEDRTRTYASGQSEGAVDVTDDYARRHGGPNNTDTTVKRRARKQVVPFDPSGRYSIEPFLCKDEPVLNDRNANPATFTRCPGDEAPATYRYQDPGDAALAQLPAGAVEIGQTWTFSRPVQVGREQGSGTMDYVDTLQRIDERGGERIAVIDVAASGRITPPPDVQSRGFHTATMTYAGTAEFDISRGTPGTQHYAGRVEWSTRLMGVGVGEVFEETYDAKPWSISARP